MDSKRVTNADFLVGLATVVLCVVWIVLGLRFPPGTQDGVPSCGTFPIIVSVILGAMGLGLMLRGYARPSVFFGFASLEGANIVAILGTFAALALYLLAWYHAGYVAATILLTLTLGLLYRIGLKTNILFALCFTLSTYYVFGKFFMIYMDLH